MLLFLFITGLYYSALSTFVVEFMLYKINNNYYYCITYEYAMEISYMNIHGHFIIIIAFNEFLVVPTQVKEHYWAIGTSPWDTDVQDFVKFDGKENRVYNDQLEGVLEENRWYYVTLTATNGALLNTTQTTSGKCNAYR